MNYGAKFKNLVKRFPAIANSYRRLREIKSYYLKPSMTPMGFLFSGNQSMIKGEFEPTETKLILELFKKANTVVNIGANIGYYVCLALSNKKQVIAFEPIDANIKHLLRNIYVNNWGEHVEFFPIALSNKVGIVQMFGAGTGSSLIEGWAGVKDPYPSLIPCSTLDNVIGDRLSGINTLVIVDIEGAEKMMLEGASNLMNSNPKPTWFIEITAEQHQPMGSKMNPNILATFEMFWNNGYESITADSDLRRITKDEVEKVLKTQTNTLVTSNFIFYEKGSYPFMKDKM
jgi:FkbM family methyltransferase